MANDRKKDPFGSFGTGFGAAPSGEVPTVNLAPPAAPPKKGEPKKKAPEPQGPALDPNALAYDNEPKKGGPTFGAHGSQLGVAGGGKAGAPVVIQPKNDAQAKIIAANLAATQRMDAADAAGRLVDIGFGGAPAPAGGGGPAGPNPGPTEQWRVGPSVREAFGEADKLAADAIQSGAQGREDAGIREQASMLDLQQKQAALAAKNADAEAQRQAELKSYQDKADALAQEYQHKTIKDHGMWDGKDTGQKIAGVIMLALGGFLQGSGRTQTNVGADMIQRDIDRHVQTEMARIQMAGESAKHAQGMVGVALQRFGDARLAENAAQTALYAQAELELKRQAAANKSEAGRQYAAEAIAALQEKRAQRLAQMVAYVQPGGGGGGGGVDADSKLIFEGPDGQMYQARDPESRKVLALQSTAYQTVDAGVTDYQRALAGVSASDRLAAKAGYTTDAMSKAYTAYNHVMSGIRQAQDDGVWKKGEAEMLAQTLTPPNHFSGDAVGQANIARKQARDVYTANMRAQAPMAVQSGYKETPKGLKPTSQYQGHGFQPPAASPTAPNTGFRPRAGGQ